MLTTRCPHCSTQFRVRPEQLSVRGGRVRCGHCQQPFSALAHLEELEDDSELSPRPAPSVPAPQAPAVPSPPPAAAPLVAAAPVPPAPLHVKPWPVPDAKPGTTLPEALPEATQTLILPEPPASEAPVPAPAVRIEAPAVGDDFSMNIRLEGPSPAEVRAEANETGLDFDFSGIDDESPAVPAPAPAPAGPVEPYVSKIAEELGVGKYDPSADLVFGQTVMLEEPIDIPGIPDQEPERGPESLFDERQRQLQAPASLVEDRRHAAGAWQWALGLVLLLVLGTAQFAWLFRTELTQWLPQSRPMLEQACELLGCDVPYPRAIKQGEDDLIVIDASSFTPDSAQESRFRLNATVLNKAGFDQAWPHLELTITDRFDIAIARRVLTPAEWLPPVYALQPSFEAHSEVTANLSLDLGKLPASGYRLYVFYP